MDILARLDRDGDAFMHDEPVAALLRLLDQPAAALGSASARRGVVRDPVDRTTQAVYRRQAEHFIGMLALPIGVAGPLRVHGQHAQGDYQVPLATTEPALVASYTRGARLITEAGGCNALLLDAGITRSPGFVFDGMHQACGFVAWVRTVRRELELIVGTHSRHGRLIGIDASVEGNHVYLDLRFGTGGVAAQDEVTFATEALCRHLLAHAPVRPRQHFMAANHGGDKQTCARSLSAVHGKRVAAEVTLPAALVQRRLQVDAQSLCDYWRMAAIGGVLPGTIGVRGHYANGLAALYLACGQDVACVAESAIGVTLLELDARGDLYAAVTLPDIIVGTVGGGAGLPSQRACLELLGLAGPGHANALAEVCAALALAGELSIIGSICAHEFAAAHGSLARGRSVCGAPAGSAP